ncbi:MAG: helix-turn-helix transcriptional regulator [Flavobacteriales bacterium]|nr:helix-turn-helix transcriptional regulator [Flavobacteriales bacterium]MCC6939296.1 helix-turn-helix transcriptional regulator [Flavobacteriales bacterium]
MAQGNKLGERIAILRTQKNLSVEQLATLTGISPKRLARIESDLGRPLRFSEACLIAHHLGMTIDHFANLVR